MCWLNQQPTAAHWLGSQTATEGSISQQSIKPWTVDTLWWLTIEEQWFGVLVTRLGFIIILLNNDFDFCLSGRLSLSTCCRFIHGIKQRINRLWNWLMPVSIAKLRDVHQPSIIHHWSVDHSIPSAEYPPHRMNGPSRHYITPTTPPQRRMVAVVAMQGPSRLRENTVPVRQNSNQFNRWEICRKSPRARSASLWAHPDNLIWQSNYWSQLQSQMASTQTCFKKHLNFTCDIWQ